MIVVTGATRFSKWVILLAFLFCALPAGLMSALITPLGQSPDEPKHLARAAGLLHGAVLGVRKIAPDFDDATPKPELQTGFKVDKGLYVASLGKVSEINGETVETAADLAALQAEPADHARIFINAPNTATYFPMAYVPAAFGLAVGLAAGASPYHCVLLARIFAFAAFLVAGGLAVWVTEYGEAVLLTVLLLPMTLFLSGTENQDGLLIALACLACAAMTRAERRWRGFGLCSFAVFLLAKPPYALMLGAFTLPLFTRGFSRRLGAVALVCLPVLLWVVIIAHYVVVPFARPPYHPGPLYTGDRGVIMDHASIHDNLEILLARPVRVLLLPWRELTMLGKLIPWSMVGVLGLVSVPVALNWCWAWCAAFGVAVLGLLFQHRDERPGTGTKILNFGVVMLLTAATLWLLMIMLYLDWSNAGQDYASGIQGRYLLPLLPFMLFAIPGFRWRFALPPLVPALPAIALGLADIGYIPMKLMLAYYVH